MEFNRLIPELTVTSIQESKQFYLKLLGFSLEYERSEEKFAFVSLGGAQFMLEEFHEDGWNVAPLSPPFGRGVNFSIEVDDVDRIYNALLEKNYPLYRSMTTRQYQVNGKTVKQKEFLVQDPDGYLLRFTEE